MQGTRSVQFGTAFYIHNNAIRQANNGNASEGAEAFARNHNRRFGIESEPFELDGYQFVLTGKDLRGIRKATHDLAVAEQRFRQNVISTFTLSEDALNAQWEALKTQILSTRETILKHLKKAKVVYYNPARKGDAVLIKETKKATQTRMIGEMMGDLETKTLLNQDPTGWCTETGTLWPKTITSREETPPEVSY